MDGIESVVDTNCNCGGDAAEEQQGLSDGRRHFGGGGGTENEGVDF